VQEFQGHVGDLDSQLAQRTREVEIIRAELKLVKEFRRKRAQMQKELDEVRTIACWQDTHAVRQWLLINEPYLSDVVAFVMGVVKQITLSHKNVFEYFFACQKYFNIIFFNWKSFFSISVHGPVYMFSCDELT
jgi:hypothetical protein